LNGNLSPREDNCSGTIARVAVVIICIYIYIWMGRTTKGNWKQARASSSSSPARVLLPPPPPPYIYYIDCRSAACSSAHTYPAARFRLPPRASRNSKQKRAYTYTHTHTHTHIRTRTAKIIIMHEHKRGVFFIRSFVTRRNDSHLISFIFAPQLRLGRISHNYGSDVTERVSNSFRTMLESIRFCDVFPVVLRFR